MPGLVGTAKLTREISVVVVQKVVFEARVLAAVNDRAIVLLAIRIPLPMAPVLLGHQVLIKHFLVPDFIV